MSKEQVGDLNKFLKPFNKEVVAMALWLRDFVWDLYPESNELIYDNYNALAFGWSPTDKVAHIFCSVALYRGGDKMHFGFYWGSQIKDPEKMLLGEGKQYRYIRVTDKKSFPKAYMKKLIEDANINSLSKVKDESQLKSGLTIVKSVSSDKRKKTALKPLKTSSPPKK